MQAVFTEWVVPNWGDDFLAAPDWDYWLFEVAKNHSSKAAFIPRHIQPYNDAQIEAHQPLVPYNPWFRLQQRAGHLRHP